MDYYKYWLLNHFPILKDIITYIKKYTAFILIKAPLWDNCKFINNIYVENGIVYVASSLSNWHPELILSATYVSIVDYKINKIQYIYRNHSSDMIGYMDIYIDFKRSNINPKYLTIYSTECDIYTTSLVKQPLQMTWPKSESYITRGNVTFVYNPSI